MSTKVSNLKSRFFLVFLFVAVSSFHAEAQSLICGDINGSGKVGLEDAVQALQIIAGSGQSANINADTNGDRKIGIEEAVFILEIISGIRQDWEPDRFVFDVEWDPNTTFISENLLPLLKNSDDVNHIYTFDAAGVQSAGLDFSEGRILVIYGKSLRRIVSVTQSGEDIKVETEFSSLTDAIVNGTIAWNHGVEFTPQAVRAIVADGKRIIPRENLLTFSLTYSGYTYDIEMNLLKEQADVKITVSKGVGDSITMKFIAQGTIQRFRSINRIDIRNKNLNSFEHALNQLGGDLVLELIVAGSASSSLNFKPELTIFEVPFLIGYIPVTLAIKAQFVAALQVPIDGSVHIKTGFTYNSDLGLVYKDTTLSSNATVGPYKFTNENKEIGASSNIAANFGIGFPRIQLGIAGELVVPWAQTAYLIGGSFTTVNSPVPLCLKVEGEFIGAAGVDFAFFGEYLNKSINFWSKKEVFFESAECPKSK